MGQIRDEKENRFNNENINHINNNTDEPFLDKNSHQSKPPHFHRGNCKDPIGPKTEFSPEAEKISTLFLNSGNNLETEAFGAPLHFPTLSETNILNLKDIIPEYKGKSLADPMRVLLMAAETEVGRNPDDICLNYQENGKLVLPRMKILDTRPSFLTSQSQVLPSGLPSPFLDWHCPMKGSHLIDSAGFPRLMTRKYIAIDDILTDPLLTLTNNCIKNIPPEPGKINNNRKKGTNLKFECTILGCSKVFPSRSRLRRHLLIHTGQKPFECQHKGCERKFSRRDNMMQHARTHGNSNGMQSPTDGRVNSGENVNTK